MGETCSFPNCNQDEAGGFFMKTSDKETRMPLCLEHIGHIGAIIARCASEGKEFLEEVFKDV